MEFRNGWDNFSRNTMLFRVHTEDLCLLDYSDMDKALIARRNLTQKTVETLFSKQQDEADECGANGRMKDNIYLLILYNK